MVDQAPLDRCNSFVTGPLEDLERFHRTRLGVLQGVRFGFHRGAPRVYGDLWLTGREPVRYEFTEREARDLVMALRCSDVVQLNGQVVVVTLTPMSPDSLEPGEGGEAIRIEGLLCGQAPEVEDAGAPTVT